MSNLVPCSLEEADTHLLLHEADADMSNLVPCSLEEADTHLLLHEADALQKGKDAGNHGCGSQTLMLLVIVMFKPDDRWSAFGDESNSKSIYVSMKWPL